jgi:hypothetical protein
MPLWRGRWPPRHRSSCSAIPTIRPVEGCRPQKLLEAAAQLQRRGGWLIVDEAFGDPDPENCVTALAGGPAAPNLIVLRSLGKFFGLAGARVGFVFGAPDKLERLREVLGPWPLSGPARTVARQALADGAWQAQARRDLALASARLASLLAPLGEVSHCALVRHRRDSACLGTLRTSGPAGDPDPAFSGTRLAPLWPARQRGRMAAVRQRPRELEPLTCPARAGRSFLPSGC